MTPKGTGRQVARAAAERDPLGGGGGRTVRAEAQRDKAGGRAAGLGGEGRAGAGRTGEGSLTK
jgi:hypothetical protein